MSTDFILPLRKIILTDSVMSVTVISKSYTLCSHERTLGSLVYFWGKL